MTDTLRDTWELEAEVTALMSSTSPLPGLQELLIRPAWHSAAACRNMGVKTFFPPEGASVNGAKSVCRRCAVSDECLKYALANPSLKGIWAGTSERRRRALRKQGPAATISISKAPIACSG